MKIFIILICTAISLSNYTVLIVGKPIPENPLQGNLFKLNSNATSKLRSIYTNFIMPGTVINANERDNSIDIKHNKNVKQNDGNSKDTSSVRAHFKPYIYEIEAVLFENDTNQEKPVTYAYDVHEEVTNSKSNPHIKSFIVNESRIINSAIEGNTNATVGDDEFLSINYIIRIDKNILQILSQVLTDFVQKIFKKTLMSYITQNMNHTMSQLNGNKLNKMKMLFNYAIDLKSDPMTGRFPITISNNGNNNNNKHSKKKNNDENKSNNHQNNNELNKTKNEHNFVNTTKAPIVTFRPQSTDIQIFLEKLIRSHAENERQITDMQNNGRENGFLIPYEDFYYDINNNPMQFQNQ